MNMENKIDKEYNNALKKGGFNPMRNIIGDQLGLNDWSPKDAGEEPISKGADPNYERNLEDIY